MAEPELGTGPVKLLDDHRGTQLLEKAVLRGHEQGAGSGELLNEEAWGDGRRWQCEPSV